MTALAILQLPELKVTEYQEIHLAIESAARNYGEAARIASLAWQMWNEGIDAGYTYEVTDNLLQHALFAEGFRKQAQQELDAAKQMLLAVMS